MIPDDSIFSVNRHGRFRDSDVLRRVFDRVMDQCLAAGPVGGEGFAVDAKVIKADARRFKTTLTIATIPDRPNRVFPNPPAFMSCPRSATAT